jgi:hypothetical protein
MSMTSDFLESLQWDEAGHHWFTSDGIEVHPKQLLKLTVALVREADAVHEAMWSIEDLVGRGGVVEKFRKALAAFERYFERQAGKAGL